MSRMRVPALANKLGARWADFIGTVYEGTGLKPRAGADVERVGLPLRPAIASLTKRIGDDRAAVRRESAAQLGVDPNRPLVLVTGGSLGAQSLNRAIASSAADLLAHAQIIHLTGRGKISEVRELVTASAGADVLTGIGPESAGQGDYHTAEYLERIDLAFACADLVICRAGAGSVSELAALGPAGHLRAAAHRQRRAAFQRRTGGERRRRPSGRRQGPDPAVGA